VISLKDLAAMLVELCPGANVQVVPFPPDRKAIDIGDYYGDFTRINTDLNWQPKVGLRDGLAASLDYYRKHHRHYWDAP